MVKGAAVVRQKMCCVWKLSLRFPEGNQGCKESAPRERAAERASTRQRTRMAVSLLGTALGWICGTNPKQRSVVGGAEVGRPCSGAEPGPEIVLRKSKRRLLVEFRESREAWYKRLAEAETYDEWYVAAERLDEIEGHLEWKAKDASPHYDSKLLRERIRQVQHMEAQKNMSSIVNWLRSGLQRNFVGTGNIQLFDHMHVGTKYLIERHHCEMTRLLYEVANCRDEALSLEKRLAFFTEARHALGKSALLLSGGLGRGMYHLGVVKALHEQNLLPRIISASSFGAVMAAVVGTSTVDELTQLFESVLETDDNICGHLRAAQEESTWSKLRRLMATGHWLDSAKLDDALTASLGDVTFHEAYEKTGRIINITVASSSARGCGRVHFLNYLTAPNILLWSAASASCGQSGANNGRIMAKDLKGNVFVYSLHAEDRWCSSLDGDAAGVGAEAESYQPWEDCSGEGVHAEMPMNRLKELFNVNFFIVSQSTTCAIPFVQASLQQVRREPEAQGRAAATPSLLHRMVRTLGYLLQSEVLHRCDQAISLGLAPKVLKQVLNQKYVGDVTIAPQCLQVCGQLIARDACATQRDFLVMGQRRTWPIISHTRAQCEAEFVLDVCVRHLAAQVQRKAQRLARRCNSLVYTPTFRQQRHTHLDLNQFFSPELTTAAAAGARCALVRGEVRSSSSERDANVVPSLASRDVRTMTHGSREHASPAEALQSLPLRNPLQTHLRPAPVNGGGVYVGAEAGAAAASAAAWKHPSTDGGTAGTVACGSPGASRVGPQGPPVYTSEQVQPSALWLEWAGSAGLEGGGKVVRPDGREGSRSLQRFDVVEVPQYCRQYGAEGASVNPCSSPPWRSPRRTLSLNELAAARLMASMPPHEAERERGTPRGGCVSAASASSGSVHNTSGGIAF